MSISLLISSIAPSLSYALDLPAYNQFIGPSSIFNLPTLKGIQIYPEDPFKFSFLIDEGNKQYKQDILKKESSKLIKYFLASLTIPEEDLWVNLSPYEKDSIIPQELGLTDMGKDLLGEDYILKQLLSSLTYPDSPSGKKFWDKVYKKAQELYGTTKIPIDTFNKVWIMPDKAIIYEDNNKAYVKEAKLKVMLEEDYVALSATENRNQSTETRRQQADNRKEINTFSSQIMKDTILPIIEKEVNQGKNFSNLRQIYHSLILATYFKNKLKQNLINQVYSDKKKTKGIDINNPQVKEEIYSKYLEAFKKGIYDYIKKDFEPSSNKQINRRYFSGGWDATTMSSSITTLSKPVGFLVKEITSSAIEVDIEVVSSGVKNEEVSRRSFLRLPEKKQEQIIKEEGEKRKDSEIKEVRITRRNFVKALAAGMLAVIISPVLKRVIRYFTPNSKKQAPQILRQDFDNDKLLATFAEGNSYWRAIAGNPENIPLSDRLVLGKMMQKIDKKVKIHFAQGGLLGRLGKLGKMEGTYRLYSPKELELKIFHTNRMNNLYSYFSNMNEKNEFIRLKLAAAKQFYYTLTNDKYRGIQHPGNIVARAISEAKWMLGAYKRQIEKESDSSKINIINALSKAITILGEKERAYITKQEDVGESLTIEEQIEYINCLRANLAYQLHYYFPNFTEEMLGGKLKYISLQYGCSKTYMAELYKILTRGGGNPYMFLEAESLMRGGYYKEYQELNLVVPPDYHINKPIQELGNDIFLHEVGHVLNAVLNWRERWRINRIAGSILKLSRDDYNRVFSIVDTKGIYPKGTSYGYKDKMLEVNIADYNPKKETSANLYMLCGIGRDFPEVIRDGWLKNNVDKKKMEKIYLILDSWRQYLLKQGYKGNPTYMREYQKSIKVVPAPRFTSGKMTSPLVETKAVSSGVKDEGSAKENVSSSALKFNWQAITSTQEMTAKDKETFIANKVQEAPLATGIFWENNHVFPFKLTNVSGNVKEIAIVWDSSSTIYRIKDKNVLSVLYKNPDMLKEINNILMECYIKAIQIYPWKNFEPWSFRIISASNFNSSGPLTLNVGDIEVRELLRDIEKKDAISLQSRKAHLVASFAHELVHVERDEIMGWGGGPEIVSQIIQCTADPQYNKTINRWMDEVLNEIQRQGNLDNLDRYDKDLFMGLIIVLHKLKDKVPEIKGWLSLDSDKYKIASLKRLISFLSTLDSERLNRLRKDLLDELLYIDNAQLGNMFFEILEKNSQVVSSGIERKGGIDLKGDLNIEIQGSSPVSSSPAINIPSGIPFDPQNFPGFTFRILKLKRIDNPDSIFGAPQEKEVSRLP